MYDLARHRSARYFARSGVSRMDHRVYALVRQFRREVKIRQVKQEAAQKQPRAQPREHTRDLVREGFSFSDKLWERFEYETD